MDKLTIGLTGGTGTIGQKILKLEADNFSFIVPTSKADVANLYQHENVTYITSCQYNKNSYVKSFKNASAIIHAGATTPRSTKRSDELGKYIDNLYVSDELFAACVELGITNIVNLSSCAVYPKSGTKKFTENEEGIPRSKYGLLKKVVEQLGEYYNEKYNMRIKSLRISMVLDENVLKKDDLISTYIKCSLKHQPLCVYGNGNGFNDYVWVDDVVQGVIAALSQPESVGIYNIASGESTSPLTAAQVICEVFGNTAGYLFDAAKKSSEIYSSVCIEKAKNELGYIPQYSFKKIIKKIKEQLFYET